MSTQREKDTNETTKGLPLQLRIRLADHLKNRAENIEQASTKRHIELVENAGEELTIVRFVSDQHQTVVCRIAQELKNPQASIEEYQNFGKHFATTAVEKKVLLRDAINGLLFLKSEMMHEIEEGDFLLELSSMELKNLMDFIGTRIDVLFTELAISYHNDFTEHIRHELEQREKQNQQKDLFIRIASHEIRNPLMSALALCELAELEGAQEGDIVKKADVKYTEIKSYLHLINRHLSQLLDMSLLEDDKITIKREPTDLQELLHQTKVTFERTRKENVIEFIQSTSVVITTDQDKVEQIILNLLQNAAKYSDPGSKITLTLTQNDAQTVIAVTDSGKGILEENLEKIFDPYTRLSANDQSVDGLGLGLYISRTLAQALGGTLTVKSEVDKGSTFTLTLPLN